MFRIFRILSQNWQKWLNLTYPKLDRSNLLSIINTSCKFHQKILTRTEVMSNFDIGDHCSYQGPRLFRNHNKQTPLSYSKIVADKFITYNVCPMIITLRKRKLLITSVLVNIF